MQAAAAIAADPLRGPTCIHVSRLSDHIRNHDKARRDFWNSLKAAECTVRYFILYNRDELYGYVRCLRLAKAHRDRQTWALDYVTPFSYAACILVARQLEGTVLVKQRLADDQFLMTDWPVIVAGFPALKGYEHHQTHDYESAWLLAPTPKGREEQSC